MFKTIWNKLTTWWDNFEGWVAEQAPGWKTKTVALLGLLGNAAYSLQEYVTHIPATKIMSVEAMGLITVVLFTLSYWFRRVADKA